MSIQSEINRINQNISDALDAIVDKGVDVPSNSTSDDLANLISQISNKSENDVTFYDYDGTIIASYSANEFSTLASMPSNPSHNGLVAQGWNWSLADAKSYVAQYGKLNIGQMYITDDGKTRIYIHLEENDKLSPYLGFAVNGTATIEWGDGSTDTVNGSSISTIISTQHTYETVGDYVIKISVNGVMHIIGDTEASAVQTSTGTMLLRKNSGISNDHTYQNIIQHIEIGNYCVIDDHAFNFCIKLTSITIPNEVTSMGKAAFYNCFSLTSITIPNGVTSIKTNACYNCHSLTSITIPNGVTNIANNFCYNCHSLTSITIPNGVTNIENDFCYNCSLLTSVTIPNEVTSMEKAAFYNCHSLTNITIPNGVTNIDEQVFYNCHSLTNITIPNGVTNISPNAFAYCYSLTSVTIPEGVTSIGGGAFYYCSSLESVTIPEGVTSIGSAAFAYCYSLTSVTIPDSVTSIGSNVFAECHSLTSVTIPDSVTSINRSAFSNCLGLMEIVVSPYNENYSSADGMLLDKEQTRLICCPCGKSVAVIPDSVTNIGDYAFQNCSRLTSVTIPEGVTSIGSNVFYYCRRLMSVTIPASVTSIGVRAFAYCSSLTSVTIPSSVTSMGSYAFNSCSSLSFIKFSSTIPPTVSNINAWNSIPTDCIIYVPSGTLSAYTSAANYPNSSTYTYVEY